jgi:hypothetical protein
MATEGMTGTLQGRRFLAVAGLAALLGLDSNNVVQVELPVGTTLAFVVARGPTGTVCLGQLAPPSDGGVVELVASPPATPAACGHDLAVMSLGHAMYFDSTVAWQSAPISLPLKPEIPVPLNIWVPATMNKATIIDQVKLAKMLFEQNLVGIDLTVPTAADISTYPASTSAGSGCASTTQLVEGALYDPARINVYYVPLIIPDALGYACYEWGAPNIIFIKVGTAADYVLAHELGHAFGLQYAPNGHEADPVRFPDNIMSVGVYGSPGNTRNHFSLGQVFRMNVDTRSALNLPRGSGPTATPFRDGTVRVCEETVNDGGVCLPLIYDRSP